MRRILTIIGLLVALLCIACNPDTQLPTGDGYSVRSDVESISGVSVQSRGYAEEGDPIIGVLLKFDGDDEFYIEYLNGDIREKAEAVQDDQHRGKDKKQSPEDAFFFHTDDLLSSKRWRRAG